MKIHITGNAGSGKTSFAKQVGELLDIPVYGLDKIVWQEGWKQTPIEVRRRLEAELVEKEEWIIEGVSSIARQASDTTLFLDVPRYVCLYRVLKRSLQYLFKSRPELPDNCPEILIIPRLIRIVWQFPIQARNNILADMDKNKDFLLISKRDKYKYLERLNIDSV